MRPKGVKFGRARVLGCMVALLLAAGCAEEGESNDGSSASATSTPSSTPDPGPVELTGVPEAGVEEGCWLLDGHLLLGGDTDMLASGQPLRVTGSIDRGVMSTCQQGTPFRVDTAEPLR